MFTDRRIPILTTWLLEVSRSYDLYIETYLTSIYILYEYYSKVTISNEYLQLVGCICLDLAHKMVEGYDSDFFFTIPLWQKLCENAYTSSDYKMIERHILQILNYNIQPIVNYVRDIQNLHDTDTIVKQLKHIAQVHDYYDFKTYIEQQH